MRLSPISLAITRLGRPADPDAAIKALFAAGEVGAWYDPSDLSTMFQDSNGITPVTADGQPVGLILDKSKELALGPELITNGDFSAGSSGWTTGSEWTIGGGQATLNFVGSYTNMDYVRSFVAGKLYKLTFNIVSQSGVNGVRCGIIPSSLSANLSGVGLKTVYLIAPTSPTGLRFQGNFNTLNTVIDNISVKEVSGNHAYQATAAARPLYKTNGTYHWLQFDGVDDFLSTSAIDFTSTDKVTIFAGVEKKTDPAQIICELGPNINATPRTFYVVAGADVGDAGYSSTSRGTASLNAGQVAAIGPFLLVNRGVLSCTHDIPADLSRIRRNTVYGVDGTADKGSGNFENMPFNIGARYGSSLKLNGNIYSLIVRGALSTAQQITDAEAWVNRKTGAY